MRNPIQALTRVENKAPVPYSSTRGRSLSWFTGQGNYESQMATYGSVSTLFSIVNLNSRSVAMVDWKLYRKQTDNRRVYGPDESQRREVTQHPALQVWSNPNEFYTSQLFVESIQQHIELTGESDWVVFRDSRIGIPLQIWPIRPDRIVPIPDPQNFIAGYVYISPDGERVPLNLNEVIRVRMPSPLDPYRGMGPVQSLMLDLETMRNASEWNRNYFLNGAEPGGIIQIDTELTDEEFRRFRDRWDEQHRGVSRAHRVALLESGAKWVERQFNMKDMQFAELRADNREIIREAYGIHPHMLGMSDSVNRANAEAAELVYAKYHLVPRLERLKDVLNSQFLPLFGTLGSSVEFDYCNPVPEDREADNAERESKARSFITYINAGADPQLVAEFLGLPDLGISIPSLNGGEGNAATGSATRQLPPAG